jgi:hypothetical protein
VLAGLGNESKDFQILKFGNIYRSGRFALVIMVKTEFIDVLVVVPCTGVVGHHHFGGDHAASIFNPKNGDSTVLRNVDIQPPHYMAQ